ncbi:sugar phosphate isomerase/epimerase [candidate division KSB1 bacterium]|nr:sugar phosphate isomerase/epimerase [candidate division KSB1 bacterium]
MNIGISTAWQSGQTDDGNRLLDLMASTGLSCLELDYRITAEMLKQMLPRLRSSEFCVLTVHNYCPLPPGFSKEESASILNLASTDRDERALAVKYSKKTLQLAADLEARLVVFHLGAIDMEYEKDALFDFYRQGRLQSDDYKEWQEEIFDRRARSADKYMQPLLRSLDALNSEAYRLGVLIGAENRYRINQLPFGDEFEILFKEFSGGQLRYWHDIGHAEIYHRLQMFDHQRDYLNRWSPHLAGFHLHDVEELHDHLAPGQGDFDFDILKPFIKDDTIRILEIHSKANVQDIRHGVEMLQEKGIA